MSRASSPDSARTSPFVILLVTFLLSLGLPTVAVAATVDSTSNTDSTSTTDGTSDDTDDGEATDDADDADSVKTNRSRNSTEERGKRSGEAAGHADEGTAGTSGEPTEEQPLSNADENDGGANGDCPDGEYCSTRDGSPSENGAGDGEATGKPCAGCVGKADNKNPKGQLPNAAEDGNNGYECDDNQGIGKGNPAHTACTADETLAEDELEPVVAGVEAVADATAAKPQTADPKVAAVETALGPVAGLLPNTGAGALLGAFAVAGLGLLVVGATMLRRRVTS